MPPPENEPLEYTSWMELGEFLDPAWYRERYPDIATGKLDAYQHFVRFGAAEKRDPNRFFDSEWYVEHYPDVAASGLHPLLHYAQAGAAELRNPHPRFDAVYYVRQHPDAAVNPLLYHLRVGIARGYLTEKPIRITDYLPSENRPLPLPPGVFADVVIPLHRNVSGAMGCIRSVLADRALPLARIIVVDDRAADGELEAWLGDLAAEGQIHLIRTRRRLGVGGCMRLGIDAAEGHDVVLLDSDTEVPAGWLRRLVAQACAQPDIATVSPLSDHASIRGYPDAPLTLEQTPAGIDEMCRTLNVGRAADAAEPAGHCVYVRRAALLAAGDYDSGFAGRAQAAGWRHRIACDTFVPDNQTPRSPPDAIAFQFVVTAALFRQSKLPVILMVTHPLGGGVRRHIDSLVERYRHAARFLLLEGTVRGAALTLPALSDHTVLTLPRERIGDLTSVLRSAGLTRIHIHHMLQMDIDIRSLVHRMGVPFDLTVHDYFAICPQINLLRWSEGLYCGEPGPADCNACIAEQSSHGARDIVSWRRGWAWQFIDADRVICPSGDVKARLDRHGLAARGIVVPHEQQTATVWATRLAEFPAPPLRIVLLGVLANHKGARAVAEVAEAAAPGTIELHLIGHLEASFPRPARKLIKVTGAYRDAELPALLSRIGPHAIWFPAPWPETYSYTLSSAIATGLPIVASDIGSFKERLGGRPRTWLVDHRACAQDWLAVFEAVCTALRERIEPPPASRAVAVSDFYTGQYLSPPDLSPPDLSPRVRPVATVAGVAGKPRIAIVPERYSSGGLTPCAYIRLLQPLDHPAVGGIFDIVLADAETIFDCHADIIVTQRSAVGDVGTADRLAQHARRTGAKLLFDLDDDLLNVPDSHPDAAELRPFEKVVRRLLTLADAVWVSTSGLAGRLAAIRPDAAVIENRLDERIWIEPSARATQWTDPVRILCMGTTSHDSDFAMIEPVLVRLTNEYAGRVVIDVLGMTSRNELAGELNRVGPPTHASRSYPGFVNWLISARRGWHIGLAPLLDTPFNSSKSPLKAMDYAALGLAVLASDTPVYRGSIADGAAGQLVANDPRNWHAALDWLIRDRSLRETTAIRARQAFLDQATLGADGNTRPAALLRLLPDVTANGAINRLRDAPPSLTMSHGATDPVTRKRRPADRGR